MRPVKVLYVNGGALDYGGISTVLMNYAARMDRERVAVDFVVHGEKPGPREGEALALGAKVLHVPYKAQGLQRNREALGKAMEGYDIVHAHMDGMNGYVLKIAKEKGIPRRISHCHNTKFLTTNPARVLLHRLTAERIKTVATAFYACSADAGRFLYGDAFLKAGKVTVIHNAIELDRFRFDPSGREKLRAELGVQNRFVIGSVGRYDYQKNQAFLIEHFPAVLALRPEAVLLLAGDGGDRAMLEEKMRALHLENSVRLLGYRQDVAGLFSAFDRFVLPSRFEGLGIVLIEAQMSGLSCLASDSVPRDTAVTACRYLPLTEGEAWVQAMAEKEPMGNRDVDAAPFRAAGYDIDVEAEKLQRRYLEMLP